MTTELLIEYCIYAAVIVIGIVILGAIHRKGRLPGHGELKNRILAWKVAADDFLKEEETAPSGNFAYYKRLSKLLYKLDKIMFVTSTLAEKERDMEIAQAANGLQSVGQALLPYKFGKREEDTLQKIRAAVAGVDGVLVLLDQVILRDSGYKAHRKQKG